MKIWIFLTTLIILNIYSVSSYALVTDGIAAIVNDRIILNSDIKKFLFFLKQQKADDFTSIKEDFLKEKVIHKLILEDILLDKAESLNINISDTQVDQIIQNIAMQKKINIAELKNNILFNDKNSLFRYDDYRNNIKKELTIQTLQENELYKDVNISEKEVDNFFAHSLREQNKHQKVNVSYILIPFLGKNIQKNIHRTQLLAESIIKKFNDGYSYQDFYNSCTKNSDRFSVKNLSWMSFGNLQKMFINSLNITKKGEILGPFLEKKGFYIVKINGIYNSKEKFLTEMHLQEFVIKFSPMMKSEIIKKNLFTIYKNLKKGVYDFNYVIKNFSNHDYKSNKTGDLGWILYDSLDKNFQKVLINLKKHEISTPIQSNTGWHIFKILNKRRVNQYYLTEKNQAYNIVLNHKIIIAREEWIKNLIRLSYIHIIK